METTERLFLGLHLDSLFLKEVSACAEKLRVLYPDQKWVRLRHFHFTIHFLGDTTTAQKEKIRVIAKSVAAATKPFPVALEGMGAFPSLTKPRVIWIGAAEECCPDLSGLYDKVTRPLINEGFAVEHETFTPHATLFRVRAEIPIVWDKNIFNFSQTAFRTIDRLMLFKSISGPDGSEYQPIEEFLFGAGYTNKEVNDE